MNKCSRYLIALVVLTAEVACGQLTPAEDEWVRICPGERFCFYCPADLREVPVQAIDSVVGQYRSKKVLLHYDFGMYPVNFDGMSKAIGEDITIAGRSAQLQTTGSAMALVVPQVGDGLQLSMLLEFTGSIDDTVGRRIFESIEFLPEAK